MKCVSDNPQFVEAHGEIDDMEGYFCNVKFIGDRFDHENIPSAVKITVLVSSQQKHQG
jgi:hypothetical protein